MYILQRCILAFIYIVTCVSASTVHEFYYRAEYTTANPDGVFEKRVISFNGSWPLPTIEVNKGDRVKLHLINGLDDATTSLHFHGLKMKGINHMDGPVGVTQCPIPINETMVYDFIVEQTGTFWYHSHSGAQYSDGLRGMFVVHDPENEENYKFDKELAWSISDWYHLSNKELIAKQLTRYNPTGGEPIPQNILFNDSRNVTIPIEYDTTYLIRIANIGIMVSQFFSIPGYEFEIIEQDGIYTKPTKAEMVYITVGQRVSILLKTKSKSDADSNILIFTALDERMLDTIPDDLEQNSYNYMIYDEKLPNPEPPKWTNDHASFEPIDDMLVKPFYEREYLGEPDHRIEINLRMLNLGDGINYAFFNNYTYVMPKVPTLLSVLSAPENLVKDARIYGSNTNSFVLNSNEIVELVINNEDDNIHPMHMHGHQFQVLARSGSFEEPVAYDPEKVTLDDNPMLRDTLALQGNGYSVMRFRANNPGVWFFHCHLDFHLEQGLAITLIEAPDLINIELPESHKNLCKLAGMGWEGNAAGNTKDFLDLTGENLQPQPLPEGFTLKGYIGLFACTIVALWGLYNIYEFGMKDVSITPEEKLSTERRVTRKYIDILERLKNDSVIRGESEEFITEIDKMLNQVVSINKRLDQL